jgi:hypothetical protein
MRSSIAANSSWAHTENRTARTQPGRDAMQRKFEDQVDPERKLTADERQKRAANARRAHFQRLALKSAKVRRHAKDARTEGGAA